MATRTPCPSTLIRHEIGAGALLTRLFVNDLARFLNLLKHSYFHSLKIEEMFCVNVGWDHGLYRHGSALIDVMLFMYAILIPSHINSR